MPQYTKRLLVGCRKNDLILSFLLRCVFLGDANLPFVRGSCAVVVVVVSPLSTFLNNPTSNFFGFGFWVLLEVLVKLCGMIMCGGPCVSSVRWMGLSCEKVTLWIAEMFSSSWVWGQIFCGKSEF
jgi:hypothetical protein